MRSYEDEYEERSLYCALTSTRWKHLHIPTADGDFVLPARSPSACGYENRSVYPHPPSSRVVARTLSGYRVLTTNPELIMQVQVWITLCLPVLRRACWHDTCSDPASASPASTPLSASTSGDDCSLPPPCWPSQTKGCTPARSLASSRTSPAYPR